MTKDEIKTRCRKAFLIVENNSIFSIDQPNNVGTQLYSCQKYAEKTAADIKESYETLEYFTLRRGREVKVCPVYIVPASKIDN
jgi:hypothetical protein